MSRPFQPTRGAAGAGRTGTSVTKCVRQLGELAVLPHRFEVQCVGPEAPGEQRLADYESGGRHGETQLVEESRIRELTGEVAAPDHPHVAVARGLSDRRPQLADVTGGEADVGA